MDDREGTQGIISSDDGIQDWIQAFLLDRRASGKKPGTVRYYQIKLKNFTGYCADRGIAGMNGVTPGLLRQYLVDLQAGHTADGVHAIYRALRSFFRWYTQEIDMPSYRSPLDRVHLSRPDVPLIEPVSLVEVRLLLETCKGDYHGIRDRAIMMTLLDTGVRATEMLDLDQDDVSLVTGQVYIRAGKGGKGRTVFLGKAARKIMRKYVAARPGKGEALFVTEGGGRLTYDGLRAVLTRRCAAAGIPVRTAHDFRRAFALNCLRAGMDIYSLQRLMGHADLQVLRRYLAQTDGDVQEAHAKYSPGDRL